MRTKIRQGYLALQHYLRNLWQSRLIKNTSWMLLAEVSARASRLITIICLGWLLLPADYGLVMLALLIHELFRVFTRVGIGAKIIQSTDQYLIPLAASAKTLQWLIAIVVCIAQLVLAQTLADFFVKPKLSAMLSIMALSHLLYPLVSIDVFLIQRSNQLGRFALISAIAVLCDNLATALLALLGFGIYAPAWAKLIAAGIWVMGFWSDRDKSIKPGFVYADIKQLLSFASKVLSSELAKASKLHLDSVFAARLLSPEAYGIYSFAKSAGVGLAQSLSQGFIACAYPEVSAQRRQQHHNWINQATQRLFKMGVALSFIFLLQASLSPIYIDWFFQAQWQAASMVMAILCLSAVPSLMLDISNCLYRADDRAHIELYTTLTSLLCLLLVLVIWQPASAQALACLVTLSSCIGFLPALYLCSKAWMAKA